MIDEEKIQEIAHIMYSAGIKDENTLALIYFIEDMVLPEDEDSYTPETMEAHLENALKKLKG